MGWVYSGLFGRDGANRPFGEETIADWRVCPPNNLVQYYWFRVASSRLGGFVHFLLSRQSCFKRWPKYDNFHCSWRAFSDEISGHSTRNQFGLRQSWLHSFSSAICRVEGSWRRTE